jgi:ABC-type Fe3+-hydroxamate transport system substrate-binding protein
VQRTRIFLLVLASAFLVLAACSNATVSSEGSSTANDLYDFSNNTPVQIDNDILQTCLSYSKSLGYEIEEKKTYTSVLLGESNISYVHIDDDVDVDKVDGNDYLIIFDEIRTVVDADTGTVLGRIPYV